VPTRLAPVFRYSAYAYSLDFAAIGTVGGDVFKAMMLARREANRSGSILASVAIDRIIGLHSLITVAGLIALQDSWQRRAFSTLDVALVAAAFAGNALLASLWLVPSLSRRVATALTPLGRAGRAAAAGITALVKLRDRPLVALVPVVSTSMLVVFLHVIGHFLVAASLPAPSPTFTEQWRIIPVAMLSAVIPLPGGTLGALDAAMSFLYSHVTGGRVASGQGLLVTMIARVASLSMVVVAAGLYVAGGDGNSEPRA